MKKVLSVTRVGFHGNTGDDRSPEDFAFPACMASLVEALGESVPNKTIHAHNRAYTKRPLNDEFLGATGMAFGLLWDKAFCMSCMDLMQVNDHAETIRRAFRWAGYEYARIDKNTEAANGVRQAIVASIDRGAPVLAFGIVDPPECAIVAGYDDGGATLIGWSHFQESLPTEPNGMFRLENWEALEWWTFILPGNKAERTLFYPEALKNGLAILEQTEIDGYLAGAKAYEAWISAIEGAGALDGAGQKALFDFHHSILFNHAEARAWGANFLRNAGAKEAARCFNKIHDLCWKADAAAGEARWKALESEAGCAAIAAVLREIRAQDERAAQCLRHMEG